MCSLSKGPCVQLLSNENDFQSDGSACKVFVVPRALLPHRKNFNLRAGSPTTSVTCFVLETSAGSLSRCGWSGESLLSHLTFTFSTVTPHAQLEHLNTRMQTCICYALKNAHTCTHSFSLFMHHL